MATPVQSITSVIQPSYSFTRPADTNVYASGDLVANNTAAASVVPIKWHVGNATSVKHTLYVPAIRLKLDNNSVTNAQFRIHVYNAAPTFTSSGDNGVFGTVVATGYASWLASYDTTIVNLQADGVAGIAAPTDGVISPFHLLGLDPGAPVFLYGLIEARAAYTPKSSGVITTDLLAEIH